MPYADPEKKKQHMKEYRRRLIDSGYGKLLYQRRKLGWDKQDMFQGAVESALLHLAAGDVEAAILELRSALLAAGHAERELAEQERQFFEHKAEVDA